MITSLMRFLDLKKSRVLGVAPRTLPALLIWITSDCNLDCRMCGEAYRREKSKDRQTLGREDWVEVIQSAKQLKTMVVSVTGGEPLLNPDLFFILTEIHKAGLASHLCTNGTLVTSEHIEALKEAKLKSISISLDSHKASTHNYLRNADCFDKTVDCIRLLKKSLPDTKLNLNYVLCRKNFRDMEEVVLLAAELGVSQVSFAPIHDNMQHKHKGGDGLDNLLFKESDIPDLEEELIRMQSAAQRVKIRVSSKTFIDGIPKYCRGDARWHDCYAGYVSCSISPWGDVSPCSDIDGTENVRKKPLHEIWRSDKFKKLREQVDACNSSCWDTTNAEMSIRCRCSSIIRNIPTVWNDYMLYGRENKS